MISLDLQTSQVVLLGQNRRLCTKRHVCLKKKKKGKLEWVTYFKCQPLITNALAWGRYWEWAKKWNLFLQQYEWMLWNKTLYFLCLLWTISEASIILLDMLHWNNSMPKRGGKKKSHNRYIRTWSSRGSFKWASQR